MRRGTRAICLLVALLAYLSVPQVPWLCAWAAGGTEAAGEACTRACCLRHGKSGSMAHCSMGEQDAQKACGCAMRGRPDGVFAVVHYDGRMALPRAVILRQLTPQRADLSAQRQETIDGRDEPAEQPPRSFPS